MPFIDVRLAGPATPEQKKLVIADITRVMVERLGKPEAAVQIAITEYGLDSYGARGLPVAELFATPSQEDALADGKR